MEKKRPSLSHHRPVRSQRQYDMMDDEVPLKPRVNSGRPRPRASNEIDVIPPEVFAFGGGFHREKTKNDRSTMNFRQRGENSSGDTQDDRPTLPQRPDNGPSSKDMSFHMNNDSEPIVNLNSGDKNINFNQIGKITEEHKQTDEGIEIVATSFVHCNIDHQSDHSHPMKVEFSPPSRRGMMSRAMSEITLSASQHPEPKQMEDIVLSPLSRHKKREFKKSPISPKGKLVPAVLRQLYADYDARSQSSDRDRAVPQSASREGVVIDNDESFSSVGDYDGFEDDSFNGGNEAERDQLGASVKSQLSQVSAASRTPRQLTPLAEEESVEMSGPFHKKRPSSLFSWSKRDGSSGSKDHHQSPRSRGKKFHVPSLKKVSVRRMFLLPSKRRDGTAVAAV